MEPESRTGVSISVAMFVASKLKRGSRTNLFTRGRWSVDQYYHMYYDETSGPDMTVAPPHDTWKGSDSHSVFWGDEAKGCGRRTMDCGCAKCRIGQFWNCLSYESDRGSWYGGVGFKRLHPTKKAKRANLRSDGDPGRWQ